jgi:hypothetical protein
MKIKICDPPEGLRRRPFTKKEMDLLNILEDDKDFEFVIREARLKSGIPVEAINVSESNTRQSILEYVVYGYSNPTPSAVKKINRKLLLDKAGDISSGYKLSFDWFLSFLNLILFDEIFAPNESDIFWVYDFDSLRRRVMDNDDFDLRGFNYLVVTKNVSKAKFMSEVDRKWDAIMSNIKDRSSPLPTSKLKNIEIKKKIYLLRVKEKLKFREIADILLEEFGETFSDHDVKRIYHRYVVSLNQLKQGTDS